MLSEAAVAAWVAEEVFGPAIAIAGTREDTCQLARAMRTRVVSDTKIEIYTAEGGRLPGWSVTIFLREVVKQAIAALYASPYDVVNAAVLSRYPEDPRTVTVSWDS